ncbi:hypothetical protein GH714_006827 [Hevea brasiliensis]|uniref:Uncharacterized protein n=1 Tax=Hevea brasiliensis TaxID=3981 RepID=A0A6A6LVX8_HEVBR|nr:hypothetical protein GH714_006827 [Hevea brasiliensis]
MGILDIASGAVGFGVGVEELLLLAIFMACSWGMWVEGYLVRTMGGTVKVLSRAADEMKYNEMARVKMNNMRHVGIKEKSDTSRVIVHEVLHEARETP